MPISHRPQGLSMAVSILALLCFAGCASKSGGDGSGTAVSGKHSGPLAEKRWILETFKDNYLWTQLLPANVDLAAHATPQDLVEHLTAKAKAEGKDHWSGVEKKTEDSTRSLLAEPDDMPFGLRISGEGPKVIIKEVQPGSSGAEAGLARGDWIMGASSKPDNIVITHGNNNELLNKVLILQCWVASQSNAVAGEVCWVRVTKAGTSVPVDVKLVFGKASPQYVPHADAPRVLSLGTSQKVGFLELKRFVPSTEPLLRKAMGKFREGNVTDLIVDLRYNGGGDLRTLKVLLDLLRAGSGHREVMFREVFNDKHPEKVEYFKGEPTAIRPTKIAFIVTGTSASASEAAVNALLPYYHRNVAIVGGSTGGKPVGTRSYPIPGSDSQLRLVVSRLLNANGQGDYFKGLPYPNFPGSTVKAEDDLDHAPGDPAEACTAAALRWIKDGSTAHGPIPEG